MNQLMINDESKVSSLDFLDSVINPFRVNAGESVYEPRKFLEKIIDELDLNETGKLIRLNNNHTVSPYYMLDKDQMMLVGMRESKSVRKSVLAWINASDKKQEIAIPQTYAEALLEAGRLALEVEKRDEQLKLAAPKVEFVDKYVERSSLQTATQVAATFGMSAVKMNKTLDEIGGVYDKRIKRSRAFCADWIAKGYGETKQNEQGYSSSLFTPAGIMRVTEIFTSEGVI